MTERDFGSKKIFSTLIGWFGLSASRHLRERLSLDLDAAPEAVSETAPEAAPETAPEAATETIPETNPDTPSESGTTAVPTLIVVCDEGIGSLRGRKQSPGMSLNLQNFKNRRGMKFAALIGFLVQATVLVFFGLMVYHPTISPKFLKDGNPPVAHAFPLTFGGTILLVTGIFLCALVVEIWTEEKYYAANDDGEIELCWVQQEKTVNDQVFLSLATQPEQRVSFVVDSRRRNPFNQVFGTKGEIFLGELSDSFYSRLRPAASDDKLGLPSLLGLLILWIFARVLKYIWDTGAEGVPFLIWAMPILGGFLAFSGFVLQFVGLRAMNSYASLVQLAAVALMTALRSLLRRGLAKRFRSRFLSSGHELDWLAWHLANLAFAQRPRTPLINQISLTQSVVGDNLEDAKLATRTQVALTARRELGRLVESPGQWAEEAVKLSMAVGETMDALLPDPDGDLCFWTIYCNVHDMSKPSYEGAELSFMISRSNNLWRMGADYLDAGMSLMMGSYNRGEALIEGSTGGTDDDWIRRGMAHSAILMPLGPASSAQRGLLKQDLEKWAPHGVKLLIGVDSQSLPLENHDIQLVTRLGQQRLMGGREFKPPLSRPAVEIGWMKSYFLRKTDPFSDQQSIELALKLYESIEGAYQKCLLFNFLWCVAQKLKKPIQGMSLQQQGTAKQVASLHNEQLDQLAARYHELGMGSEQECLVLLVVALSLASKLSAPDAPDTPDTPEATKEEPQEI